MEGVHDTFFNDIILLDQSYKKNIWKYFNGRTIVCISKSNTIKGEQIHFHIMEEKFRLMYGSLYDQYIRYEKFYWSVLKNIFS